MSSHPTRSRLEQTFHDLHEKKLPLLLLDGGTGEELFRQGVPDDRKIWSATAVVHPQYHDILKKVHRSYIQAGSGAITTNTYGITPGVGFSSEDMVKYIAIAARLAKESCDYDDNISESNPDYKSSSFILGSLGPLVESYRPDLILEHSAGVQIYSQMIHAMHPYIDAYLGETMSSVEESFQVVDSVLSSQKNNKPIIISFTLNNKGQIRSGENVVVALNRLIDFSKKKNAKLKAISFNCSEPEATTMALEQINNDPHLKERLQHEQILLGAYANRLTPVPDNWSMENSEGPQAMREDLGPKEYFDRFVKPWVSGLGVKLIGGCCGVLPEHIAFIHKNIDLLDK